jgi:PLP dependent protein
VQEALRQGSPGLPGDIEWHCLGALQSNKVRRALELFTVFHAVDRPKIAHALDAEAGARGLRPRALLEVRIGDELSKHGFAPETLAAEAAPLAALQNLESSA